MNEESFGYFQIKVSVFKNEFFAFFYDLSFLNSVWGSNPPWFGLIHQFWSIQAAQDLTFKRLIVNFKQNYIYSNQLKICNVVMFIISQCCVLCSTVNIKMRHKRGAISLLGLANEKVDIDHVTRVNICSAYEK